MRITKKFLSLTNFTYPHGYESRLLQYLPKGYKEDGYGNFYYQIGESTTMFACHLDTADRKPLKVTHVFDSNIIRTNGKTILGADDKAGMTIVLYMISKNVPGLYYFFTGEEVGCVGSSRLSENWEKTDFSKYIKKIISFDRRGTESVITHQLYGRCCSDSFATELSNRLNLTDRNLKLKPDDTGIMTDSAQFIRLVPECTNISVGYYKEHTVKEHQDISFLIRIAHAVCKIDWETLPIERDNDVFEEEDEFDCWEDDIFPYDNYGTAESDNRWASGNWAWFSIKGKTTKMFLSKVQIAKEKAIIWKWLLEQEGYKSTKINGITWNGHALFMTKKTSDEYVGTRHDLTELLPELKSVPLSELIENIPIRNALLNRHWI